MKEGNNIRFLRQKDYIFKKEIGQGGTGKTILIRDDEINEDFICKKYSTYLPIDQNKYYKNFIDEIKILHKVFHKNIVRIFNYHLYPTESTGYIIMEYIKGTEIHIFLENNPNEVENIFIQLIEGFLHLEENKIIHRDIRPANILISEDGILKIIDFGFGKIIDFNEDDKSISLNWRYSVPDEFSNKIYDHQTDIYFIGKLFEEILNSIPNIDFQYIKTLSQMIIENPKKRISSFFNIYRQIIDTKPENKDFSDNEKSIYQFFVNSFEEIISTVDDSIEYNNDINTIIKKLEELEQDSILEEYIQNNTDLIKIFINGNYSYFKSESFPIRALLGMIKLLKESSENKKKILLNHLWKRLDKIKRTNNDELPF